MASDKPTWFVQTSGFGSQFGKPATANSQLSSALGAKPRGIQSLPTSSTPFGTPSFSFNANAAAQSINPNVGSAYGTWSTQTPSAIETLATSAFTFATGVASGTPTSPSPNLTFATPSSTHLNTTILSNCPAVVAAGQRGIPQHTVGLGSPPTPAGGQTDIAPRDQALPNELLQSVETFKNFVREEKMRSLELAKYCSMKNLKPVESDIGSLNNQINYLRNELQKNKTVADMLQLKTANELENAAMALRTLDTPADMQEYQDAALINYFQDLTKNYEAQMHNLKAGLATVDKYVRSKTATVNPQDLTLRMRQLNKTYVGLAGQLQVVHNQVELQKEEYLNLLKQMDNDYTNVFDNTSEEQPESLDVASNNISHNLPVVRVGPSPFSSLRNAQPQVFTQNQLSGYPTTPCGTTTSPGFNMTGQTGGQLCESNIDNTSSQLDTSSSTGSQNRKRPRVTTIKRRR